MSGPSMLDVKQIREVNVGGTKNVLECAVKHGLVVVYTSS